MTFVSKRKTHTLLQYHHHAGLILTGRILKIIAFFSSG
jgi:hypothetical protein